MSPPRRTIKSFDLVTDLLEDILHGNNPSATLIVCWTEEKFTQQLLASIQLQTQAPDPGITQGEEQTSENDNEPLNHGLLSNTIDILDKSQRVTLSFCPSQEHLRAYLGASRQWPASRSTAGQNDSGEGKPLLAIVNLIALHIHTSAFSAQGISRTLALAVEVAARKDMDLVLCECRDLSVPSGETQSGASIWDMSVPLLNTTARAMRREDAPAAQTVQIKRLAKKWFYFPTETGTRNRTETI